MTNYTDASHLVTNLWLTERAAFIGAEALYLLECEADIPGTDILKIMEDTVLRMEEDYELALQALRDALSSTLTPEQGMLHVVAAVWDKRIAEADDYFNE